MANLVNSTVAGLSTVILLVFLTVSTSHASPLGELRIHRKGLFNNIDLSINRTTLGERISNVARRHTPNNENAPSWLENSGRPKRQADSTTAPIAAPTNQGTGNLPCLSQ